MIYYSVLRARRGAESGAVRNGYLHCEPTYISRVSGGFWPATIEACNNARNWVVHGARDTDHNHSATGLPTLLYCTAATSR